MRSKVCDLINENRFKDDRVSIRAADRTKNKIIEFYATANQTKKLNRAGLIAKGIEKGAIFLYNWTNAEKDDAMFDIGVNSDAMAIALELVYKALGNTDEKAIEDVYSSFNKNEVDLVKDLTMYVVDNTLVGNKEYQKYIRTTGDKLLDNYKGSKKQKRKSKVGTKKDTK